MQGTSRGWDLYARDKLRMGSLCKGQVEDGVSMQGTS